MKLEYKRVIEKYSKNNDNHIMLEKVKNGDENYFQVVVNGSQEFESNCISESVDYYIEQTDTNMFV